MACFLEPLKTHFKGTTIPYWTKGFLGVRETHMATHLNLQNHKQPKKQHHSHLSPKRVTQRHSENVAISITKTFSNPLKKIKAYLKQKKTLNAHLFKTHRLQELLRQTLGHGHGRLHLFGFGSAWGQVPMDFPFACDFVFYKNSYTFFFLFK